MLTNRQTNKQMPLKISIYAMPVGNQLVVWHRGIVISFINEVPLHRAWLVLGRVTIFG